MGEELLRPGSPVPVSPGAPGPEERRPPRTATWSALDAMLVILLALLLTFVATAVLMTLVRPTATALILSGLVFELSLAGFTLLWVGLRHPGSLPALGMGSERLGVDFVLGIAGGAGLFALTVLVVAPAIYTIVALFTGTQVEVPRQEILPASPSQTQIMIAALVVVVLAPLGEELFFRGLLFGALRRRFRFWAAGGISGVAFGLFHVIPLLMPLMFFVGFGLAYLYERRGSLFAPIAAHAAFNLIGFSFIVRALT
jgi:membrane protease YdiL (CAAX protease family)